MIVLAGHSEATLVPLARSGVSSPIVDNGRLPDGARPIHLLGLR